MRDTKSRPFCWTISSLMAGLALWKTITHSRKTSPGCRLKTTLPSCWAAALPDAAGATAGLELAGDVAGAAGAAPPQPASMVPRTNSDNSRSPMLGQPIEIPRVAVQDLAFDAFRQIGAFLDRGHHAVIPRLVRMAVVG